jgi:endonuclease/exonuclease/phosphatase family metal-dependent hydrolase
MQNQLFKLITLNIWGGHIEKPLLNFIKSNQDVDIFCLQEVYCKASAKISNEDRYINLDIFSEIQKLLPEHRGYFRPVVNNIYGIAMFVKTNIQVMDEGEVTIYANDNYIGVGPTHSRILQYIKCSINNKDLVIINIHGLWNGMGKNDSPERIVQSSKIKEFIDKVNTPKILCGDFNLRPDTQSLQILGGTMDDQIKIHNIQSTRTNFYPGTERFADYVFTSKDITVKNFQVLADEVSDHAPLLVEFVVKGV